MNGTKENNENARALGKFFKYSGSSRYESFFLIN